jgi:hypothetical protein
MPFSEHPNILSCDILRINDVQLRLTEYHGLISIRPDSAGLWFIRNIKNHRLHNKLIYAREYHTRKDNGVIPSLEADRRRKHLEIGKINIKTVYSKGLDQFARTL